MRLAIVGLRGCGKSTLFHAFTGAPPGQGAGPHGIPVSVVKVPDPRLEWLREVYQPKKYTPAAVEVRDFPGLPGPGDVTGAKLGELLAAAREADGLLVCVRAFTSASYPYARPEPDPAAEAAHVATELAFADLEIATRRIEKLDRKGGNMTGDERREHAVLLKIRAALEDGRSVKSLGMHPSEALLVRGYRFLTEKPWLLVLSLPDSGGDAAALDTIGGEFEARVAVRAQIEAEIAELADEDRAAFMEELGVTELANLSVLRAAFDALDCVSFFTTGEDEVRAWPLAGGGTAVEAAGTIHSDLARGFIRAEVYAWDELRAVDGDEAALKRTGKLRLEGKEYVVRDGEIVHVRFSV